MHDWINVKRMYKNGVNISQIARRMNISRNTVKKLLKQESEPRYKRARTRSKIDVVDYKEKIKAWFLEDDFIGTRIHEELVGYNAPLSFSLAGEKIHQGHCGKKKGEPRFTCKH